MTDRIQWIQEDYEIICKHIPEFEKFTFKQFCEACTIASSRAFGSEINGETIFFLAPFADMLNHRFPSKTKWIYDKNRKGLVV